MSTEVSEVRAASIAHAKWVVNSGVLNLPPHEFSKRHFGNTECRKFKFRISIIDIWHDVYTKFHEFPSSLTLVIEYVPTDIAS